MILYIKNLMKKIILISIESLLDKNEILNELFYNYKKSKLNTKISFEDNFIDKEDYKEFLNLYGSSIYNNQDVYNNKLNELISLANQSLFPVYILYNDLYEKINFHIINLISRQKNLLISGIFSIKDIHILKNNYYIYNDKINRDLDIYENELCLFFKQIETEIKKELNG